MASQEYGRDQHYRVTVTKDDLERINSSKINIVDAENTGLVQNGSVWQDGLHAYAEFREGVASATYKG